MSKARSLLLVLFLALGAVLGGCDSGAVPDAATLAEQEIGTGEVSTLRADQNASFKIKLPRLSLDVVEHYDAELKTAGWKPHKPETEEDPGQRQWIRLSAPKDDSPDAVEAGYEAYWTEPETGRVAELKLTHRKADPDHQYVSFMLYDAELSPLAEVPPAILEEAKQKADEAKKAAERKK